MQALSTIIVDDEDLARRGLALRLKQIPGINIVAECSNGQQALQAIAEHEPDLLFLDIQMPGMDGFQVLSELQADTLPMVVFVTAYDTYAVDAFKVHAVDYILKPVDEARLEEAVERARQFDEQRASARDKAKLMDLVMGMTGANAQTVEAMAESGRQGWPDKLTVRDGNAIHFIKTADITWIDAAGDYMCIHAAGKTHIMRVTMKELEAMLDPAQFLRVHRSTIVNALEITGAESLDSGEYLLHLDSGARIKVSRGYRDRVRTLLGS
ncbi:LytR/AlgR family response regulator transcription factor [Haliea sp.]|jgi:two-component system LytT family response regulator|uniref:LytR/AlgR family response regulator transcription factor n=1 Tax=Haliea sp. TaxID=1932666 RepID=UPI0035285208